MVIIAKKRYIDSGERVALVLEGMQDMKHFLYCRLCILKDLYLTLNWTVDFGRM